MISTEHELEISEEDLKLFLEGLNIVLRQFEDRLRIDEAAHAMISVAFNILRHGVEEALPNLSKEEVSDELREHLNRMLTSMEDEVWNTE
jgi:hypothetical protein